MIIHPAVVAALVIERHWLLQEVYESILSYLDVPTLIKKKQVCWNWRQICTNVIHAKRTSRPGKVFKPIRRFELLCNPTVTLVLPAQPKISPKPMDGPLDVGRIQSSRFLLHF
jgi:hypothetical protein